MSDPDAAGDAADTPDGGMQDVNADDGASSKKKLGKGVMIGGLAILLLAGGGGAAFFLGVFDSEADQVAAELKEVFYLDLPELTVNLSSSDQRAQFLKLSVSLELSDRKTLRAIEPHMPRVLDAFQVYLRELRTSDLEGSAGFFLLKEELTRRIEMAVAPAQINDILFRELLVQ